MQNIIGHFLIKYGVDTNVLVDLILYPNAKEYFKKKGYSFPDKFLCTIPQVIGETKGVLINRYNYSKDKADKEIDRILQEFVIEKLNFNSFDEDISLIEEIGQKYKLNEEDITIIYAFWKMKVKIVVARDTAFENTCKELNINVIKWPKFK